MVIALSGVFVLAFAVFARPIITAAEAAAGSFF